MNDELAARHRAITLRLAGRAVKSLCAAVGRSEAWFHKWWRRYGQSGVEGLYDLTRANQHPQRIPPELERTIISIRRRLQAHATPATRYCLIGAQAIRAELLDYNHSIFHKCKPEPSTVCIMLIFLNIHFLGHYSVENGARPR